MESLPCVDVSVKGEALKVAFDISIFDEIETGASTLPSVGAKTKGHPGAPPTQLILRANIQKVEYEDAQNFLPIPFLSLWGQPIRLACLGKQAPEMAAAFLAFAFRPLLNSHQEKYRDLGERHAGPYAGTDDTR